MLDSQQSSLSVLPRGRFITFEGGEGVGKSTNIEFCRQYLQQQGLDVLVSREPGGTEIAEIIRQQLLKKQHDERMSDMTELLLVFAARAQHLENKIKPALKRGQWVLCDRFTDSTLAYQGYGRGLDETVIFSLKQLVQQGLEPDVTFLLDADVTIGMGRAQARGPADRFEVEQLAFFQRVRQGFLNLAEHHAQRIRVLDAAQPLAQVQARLVNECQSLLNLEVRS